MWIPPPACVPPQKRSFLSSSAVDLEGSDLWIFCLYGVSNGGGAHGALASADLVTAGFQAPLDRGTVTFGHRSHTVSLRLLVSS